MYIKQEYYDVLNSSRTDSLDKIKKNYKNLCLMYHPDVGGSEDYMKEINLAMDIINEFHEETINTNKSTNSKNNTKKNYNGNKTNNKSTNYKNSTKSTYKTSTKSYNKNGRCSRCNSKYEKNDIYCTQCGQKLRYKKDNNNEDIELLCIGVGLIAIGLVLLYLFWPIGITYFYILYKFLSS